MRSALKKLFLNTALLSLPAAACVPAGAAGIPPIQVPSAPAEVSTQTLLAAALNKNSDADTRCAAVDALKTSADEAAAADLAGLLNDADPQVRACSIRAAGESKNKQAVETLLANIESYQRTTRNGSNGPYEDNIKERLKAIDSIWALGEIGDPALLAKLKSFYKESDDVLRINLLISVGKLGKNAKAGPFLLEIAASGRETESARSAAFEMLARIGQPASIANLAPSKNPGIESGDIIYTGGIIGSISGWGNQDLPIGHAALYDGVEIKNGQMNIVVSECVTNNRVPGGVRNAYSWYAFTHDFRYPYYGNRTTPAKPTAAQRARLVQLGLEMGKKGLKYNDTHFSQKGPLEFDCVGYIEYLYEQVGLNPTDDSYETGLGWPLTPWEQFISVRPNLAADYVTVKPHKCSIKEMDLSTLTRDFGALPGASMAEAAAQVPGTETPPPGFPAAQ